MQSISTSIAIQSKEKNSNWQLTPDYDFPSLFYIFNQLTLNTYDCMHLVSLKLIFKLLYVYIVRTYVCMYVYTYVCTYLCPYICMYLLHKLTLIHQHELDEAVLLDAEDVGAVAEGV